MEGDEGCECSGTASSLLTLPEPYLQEGEGKREKVREGEGRREKV